MCVFRVSYGVRFQVSGLWPQGLAFEVPDIGGLYTRPPASGTESLARVILVLLSEAQPVPRFSVRSGAYVA